MSPAEMADAYARLKREHDEAMNRMHGIEDGRFVFPRPELSDEELYMLSAKCVSASWSMRELRAKGVVEA